MWIQPNIYESCRTRPVDMLEQPDNGMQPYRLCNQCNDRLNNYALRTPKFFNLAAIHGDGYYLHDDICGNDTGQATQPVIDVEDPERFSFPDLQTIKTDLEKIVDFACVQHFTSSEVIEILKGFHKQAVLEYITFKVDYNRSINNKAYLVAAKALHSYAADWIRGQWNKRKQDELLIFAPASVACLPFDKGVIIVTKEVEHLPNNLLADNSTALLYFQVYQIVKIFVPFRTLLSVGDNYL